MESKQGYLLSRLASHTLCMRGPEDHRLTRRETDKLNKLIQPWFQQFNADQWYSIIWHNGTLAQLDSDIMTAALERKKLVITYVDRQNTGRRLPQEWHDALMEELMPNDDNIEFVHAHMENMTIEMQMDLAHRTDVLIGVHGNGLTHELFMRPRRFLIEIFPHGQPWQYDYFFFARAMGHFYAVVDGDKGLVHVSTRFHPIGFPLAEIRNTDPTPLLKAIRSIIDQAAQELLV